MNEIIHYCCGSYDQSHVGGVARYDYQIKLAFPHRKFFQGPQQKNMMLSFLKSCKNPIVITDNHLACDIPNNYKLFIVHHGCAKTSGLRNPNLRYETLEYGQEKMLTYRDPQTTTIISISQACTDDFIKYYGANYNKFSRIDILHPSELDETRFKTNFNKNPVVLGNWMHIKKGRNILPILCKNTPNFHFRQLSIRINNDNIQIFNQKKQDIYLNSDIFLQLSNSEGNSYATLDALLCGIPVVSSNVGLFYKDVPEDCFVKLDWTRNNDVKYVKEKLKYAWEHREELGRKGREWYMKNCRLENWISKMKHLIK